MVTVKEGAVERSFFSEALRLSTNAYVEVINFITLNPNKCLRIVHSPATDRGMGETTLRELLRRDTIDLLLWRCQVSENPNSSAQMACDMSSAQQQEISDSIPLSMGSNKGRCAQTQLADLAPLPSY